MTNLDWHLDDRRQFLERSLEDARIEHEAGDLTDADYDTLRRRDEEQLAVVQASIAQREAAREQEPARAAASPGAATPRPSPARRLWALRRRWWFVGAGIALVLAGALVLVHALVAPRLPGQSETGSIDLNTAQQIERQLTEAKTLVRSGKVSEALKVYGQVLSEDPKQPVALAEWGWLDWEAASRAKQVTAAAEGASALEEAVRLDKKLFAAQYYLGTMLVEEGAPKKAVVHFAQFLADKPTSSWLQQAAPEIRVAYAGAHQPLPPGV